MKIECLIQAQRRVLTFIDDETGIPLIGASIWISLYEHRYAESYLRKRLHAIAAFYRHVKNTSGQQDQHLDSLIFSLDINGIGTNLRSFLGVIQNHSKQFSISSDQKLRFATQFVIDVCTEHAARSGKPKQEFEKINRSITNLKALYKFLRPERSKVESPIRSLPISVTDEIFEYVSPYSQTNIFMTEKLRIRNFLIFSTLFYMGLRRGELLSLQTDAFQTDFDAEQSKRLFWLNIKSPADFDSRTYRPKLKNEFSVRQIPVPEKLFIIATNYIYNWRGRCSHSFLFSTSSGAPLADSSLTDIFARVNSHLSDKSKNDLFRITGRSRFSPHALRHTSAVYRIKAYRRKGCEIDHSEALMRSFFGWSHTSSMPRRYARAFYQEELSSTWFEEMNKYIDWFDQ